MKSHLDIQIEGQSLVLPDDFSISVEEQNPVFNDVSFFSYPVSVSTAQNMSVLKNIAHRDSALRGMDFEHAKATIIADGLPLNTGQVITNEGAEIGPNFEFNIDAQTESFSELIGDLECQDVDISRKNILIGEKIGDIDFNLSYTAREYYYIKEGDRIIEQGVAAYQGINSRASLVPHKMEKSTTNQVGSMSALQALGFSIPGKCSGFPIATAKDKTKSRKYGNVEFTEPVMTDNFINVSQPYPFPYCNTRVCYAHPDVKINDDGTKETDGIVEGNTKGTEEEDYGQYWCLDANRQQSGICFYVLYFLDCLFEQLGVVFDKSELLDIDDITRLCFITTQCRYDSRATSQKLNSVKEINQWLSSRNCGSQISFSFYTGKAKSGTYSLEEFSELQEEYPVDSNGNISVDEVYSRFYYNGLGDVEYHRMLTGNVSCSAYIHEMYANSLNFPNASVSSVISSLENSFGIRFLYDVRTKTVTAKLLRNVYRDMSVKPLYGTILSITPVNEKINGFRMAYSAESNKNEQERNLRKGVLDYDTDYDYIELPSPTEGQVGRRTVTNLTYRQILQQISAVNTNVYVDMNTGNVYRVKVDSDATDISSLRPILFKVGQNKGIEIGDCADKNNNVKEYISDFIPVSVNVVNAKQYNEATEDVSPIFAPLLDVDMEHEYLEKKMRSVAYYDNLGRDDSLSTNDLRSSHAFPNGLQLVCNVRMWLAENYDPTNTDTGNSPLQDIDWGLTVGVMRGAGAGTGYGVVMNAEISKTEFLDIMKQHFGSIYPENDSTIGIGVLYNYLYSLQDDLLDSKTGLTISLLRSAIEVAYDNGVESTMPGSEGYGVLFSILSGSGVPYILINGVKINKYHFGEKINPICEKAKETGYHSHFGNFGLSHLKKYLEDKISDGTYRNDTILYEKCSMTVAYLLSDINNALNYSGGGPWPSRYYYYLDLVERTGIGGTSSGSSSDTGSQIINFDENYDGFGNSKWRQTVGIYALTSDSMDLKGAIYDYDGSDSGVGGGERFSLQIRAWKQPEWADAPLCVDDERDANGNILQRIRSRGLFDVFMSEHAHFLLNRKKYRITAILTIAQLLDIRNHWQYRYKINGKIGFIDKLQYEINKKTGISEVIVDFFSF